MVESGYSPNSRRKPEISRRNSGRQTLLVLNPPTEQPEASSHHHALELVNGLCEFLRCQSSSCQGTNDLFNIADLLAIPLYQAALRGYRGDEPKRDPSWVRTQLYSARCWLQGYFASRASTPPSPVDVLFYPTDHTHVTAMLPVARCLGPQARYAFVTNKPAVHALLRQEQQQPTFLKFRTSGVVSNSGGSAPARPLRGLQAKWEEAIRRYLADVHTGERATELVLQVVRSNYRLAVGAIDAAHRMVGDFAPKVIVVGHDLSAEGRALCRVAQARGIRTLVPSHGSILGDSTHGMHIADILAVYGENQRNTLVKLGTPAEKIAIVGAPYLDQQPLGNRQVNANLAASCSLGKSPWVLVANSGPGHSVSLRHHQLTIEHLFEVAKGNPALHFVVKLHKKDHPRYYANCPAELQDRFHVIRHGTPGYPTSIFDWIAGASAVLTGASMVAIEAMLMKVPVITMDFCNELTNVDFIRCGATIHVTSLPELSEVIQGLPFADGPPVPASVNAAEYVRREFYRVDGQASYRTVAEIMKLLASRQQTAVQSNDCSRDLKPSESARL